jgi:hypothetical protein
MPSRKKTNSPVTNDLQFFIQQLKPLWHEWLICFGLEKRRHWPFFRFKPLSHYYYGMENSAQDRGISDRHGSA